MFTQNWRPMPTWRKTPSGGIKMAMRIRITSIKPPSKAPVRALVEPGRPHRRFDAHERSNRRAIRCEAKGPIARRSPAQSASR